jgi:hypothetical protein
VFSVSTEREAKKLIVLACPMDDSGQYYARELAEDQTLANLYAFGDRLAALHEHFIAAGTCECDP